MSHKNLIFNIETLVKNACFSSSNKFGETIWEYHILPVRKWGIILANQLKADPEIVEIACLFHDYSGIKNYEFYPQHHIHSAKIATNFLSQNNYCPNKTDAISTCIIEHRNSIEIPQSTLESICLASADAMAHITESVSLFYLAYNTKHLDINAGKSFIKNKITQSWEKICPLGQEIVKEQYHALKTILN